MQTLAFLDPVADSNFKIYHASEKIDAKPHVALKKSKPHSVKKKPFFKFKNFYLISVLCFPELGHVNSGLCMISDIDALDSVQDGKYS